MTAKKAEKKAPAKAEAKAPDENPFETETEAPALEKGETPLPVMENEIPASVPLYFCQAGKAMFWPLPGPPPRGGPGIVIRGDDPFVNVRGYPNQFYKLTKVTPEEREAGFAMLLLSRTPEGEKDFLRVDVTRITPCKSRRMHKEYESRGITWMPLDVQVIEEVSILEPRAAGAMRMADFASADEGFDAPPLTE